MSDKTTLARPYGKAAFEYALQNDQVAQWSEMLRLAVTGDIAEKTVSHFINFLQLLGTNHRLGVLPEISILYEEYRANYEKRVDVKITSAFALEPQEQKQLESVLQARLQRSIALECDIDQHLLGGAVIRVGDQVIDGSIRGALARLSHSLR
jgi:F-type H+-transporting ATPase subunit delta